jgi:DNA topoisomerase-3
MARLLLHEPKEPSELVIRGRLPDGREGVVSSFNGHILSLLEPDDYDPKWQYPWRLDTLPVFPPGGIWRRKPTHPVFLERVSRLLKGAEELVNACDSDREGEAIFWETMGFLHWRPELIKTTRIWWTDPSKQGTLRAYAGRKPITEKRFARMAQAAGARAQADWIIGYNGTRYLTRTIPAYGKLGNPVYPVGRVKTPTLSLVEKRIMEIERFVSRSFHKINCEFFSEKSNYFAQVVAPEKMRLGHEDSRFKNWEDAANVRREIGTSVNEWKVYDNIDQVLEYAPAPFNLTDLQRVAYRVFGWSPKQTLRVAQELYASEGAISYPRTDSSSVPTGMTEEVKAIHSRLWAEYGVEAYPKLKDLECAFDDYFFEEEVTKHHAIIPTGVYPRRTDRNGNTAEGWILWDLIVRRSLMAFFPPAQIDASSRILEFTNSSDTLTVRAILKAAPVAFAGWLEVEEALGNAGSTRKNLREREKITWPPTAASARLVSVKIEDGYTTPPDYYTEETLLMDMEKVGLGTVATRADIIEGLFGDQFLERRENGHLLPTGLGTYHLGWLREFGAKALTEPDVTAAWEKYFEKIEAGDKNIADPAVFVKSVLNEIEIVGRNLQNLPAGQETIICPRSFHPVKKSSDEHGEIYVFDGYPKTRVPVTLWGRVMKASEWRQVFQSGRSGYGPFRFISPKKKTPMIAKLRHKTKENRFEPDFRVRSDEKIIE